jgi:hypothetical protein
MAANGYNLPAMKRIVAAALLFVVPASVVAKDKTDRIEELIASTDGATKATAYKVQSLDEEYQILKALHLKPVGWDLIVDEDNHPYDILTTVAGDGTKRQKWFDKAPRAHEF